MMFLGAMSPGNSSATGGTVTQITINGVRYNRHTFLSTADFTVTSNADSFSIAKVGGGAGGGGNPDGFGRGPTGGTGGYDKANEQLSIGAHSVVVGGGGAAGTANIIGGGQGWPGGNGGASYVVGSTNVAAGGQAGTPFAAAYTPATSPAGTPSPSANAGVTAPDYTGTGLATSVGVGGWGGQYAAGGPNAGNGGGVVIEYPA